MNLRTLIRDIPDYPKEGILFYDITPLLSSREGFQEAIDRLAVRFADAKATKIVAAEARGFIFGAALAYKMGLGFVPVRKPGKLPYKAKSVSYDLEYGSDTLCMHEDAIARGERVLLIDDLMATGGTLAGVIKLLEAFGAVVAGIGVVLELTFLNGREQLRNYKCESLLQIS
jgi:adenine phosphoribosyltransferase